MTRVTDGQVRGRGGKGKLTNKFVNSLEKHIDKELRYMMFRQTDRRLVRMTDKLSDRLVNRMEGHI